MGTQESKALVASYFKAITDGRLADAWAMLADDAIWTIGGHSPLTGEYSKQELGDLTEKTILSKLVDGIKIKLERVVAEDKTVVAEFTGYGERPDGKVYNNHFCFIFTIKEGKLWRCTEYLDTYHFNDVILS